jgi:hypothetical protein
MRHKWLLKQIEQWSMRFSLTRNTVQILSHLITIFSYSVVLCGNWFFKRRNQGHGAYAASCTTEKILYWSIKMLLYRRYSKLHRYLKMTVFLLCVFCRINKKYIACFHSGGCGWVRKYPECTVLRQHVQQYHFFYVITLIFGATSPLGHKFLCALIKKNLVGQPAIRVLPHLSLVHWYRGSSWKHPRVHQTLDNLMGPDQVCMENTRTRRSWYAWGCQHSGWLWC